MKKKSQQWQNSTKETEQKVKGYKKNSQQNFEKNMQTKTTAHVKKPVDIMEIAKNVWQFTEPIRNTFQTACAR